MIIFISQSWYHILPGTLLHVIPSSFSSSSLDRSLSPQTFGCSFWCCWFYLPLLGPIFSDFIHVLTSGFSSVSSMFLHLSFFASRAVCAWKPALHLTLLSTVYLCDSSFPPEERNRLQGLGLANSLLQLSSYRLRVVLDVQITVFNNWCC